MATGRPETTALVASQVGAALRATRRDSGAVFFAVLLPLGLFGLVATTNEVGELAEGVPFTVHLDAGMATWGLAVTAFMNIPEAVVRARDRGVLKRLRGTPLSPAHYLTGRIVAGLVLGLVIAALVVMLGVVAYDMPVSVTGLALGAGLVALGAVVLAACGFLLAGVVRGARTFAAVSLVALLPVAFVSDVFLVGGPDWMGDRGLGVPGQAPAERPDRCPGRVANTGTRWHVAVLAGWGLVAGLLAVRLFRWQPPES